LNDTALGNGSNQDVEGCPASYLASSFTKAVAVMVRHYLHARMGGCGC